jgi:hypothetical protein
VRGATTISITTFSITVRKHLTLSIRGIKQDYKRDTQHTRPSAYNVIIMLSAFFIAIIVSLNAKCFFPECIYAESCYARCRYTECRYAECSGALCNLKFAPLNKRTLLQNYNFTLSLVYNSKFFCAFFVAPLLAVVPKTPHRVTKLYSSLNSEVAVSSENALRFLPVKQNV